MELLTFERAHTAAALVWIVAPSLLSVQKRKKKSLQKAAATLSRLVFPGQVQKEAMISGCGTIIVGMTAFSDVRLMISAS